MRKILCFIAIALVGVVAFAQTVTLTFTGQDFNNSWVQLDRVVISNLTRDWQETIYWPDTTLTMINSTGIADYANSGAFFLSQNNPNPFNGTTDVLLTVADAGMVKLEITDVNGRIVVGANDYSPLPGIHRFRITLSATGTYVMTARQNGKTSSIKMVNNGEGNRNGIEYAGSVRATDYSSQQLKSGTRGTTDNTFTEGDQMEYVGYATMYGTEYASDRISIQQDTLQTTHVLRFYRDGEPCLGTPTVSDINGNTYNTVQIGNQCWMQENLRATRFPDHTEIPMDTNSAFSEEVPYRYTPNNDESEVSDYGYLYNWAAVMHGAVSSDANPSGVQGICPNGWHVPSVAEWIQLVNHVSSRSLYVCGGDSSYIAKALASDYGWVFIDEPCAIGDNPFINNATGFSAHPAGNNLNNIMFGRATYLWSSTEIYDEEWSMELPNILALFGYFADTPIYGLDKWLGGSVRCVRD